MNKVRITVLETTFNEKLAAEYGVDGLGRCPFLKEGDVFYADYAKPEGFCEEAGQSRRRAGSPRPSRIQGQRLFLAGGGTADQQFRLGPRIVKSGAHPGTRLHGPYSSGMRFDIIPYMGKMD
jgi:hypothetical protein